MQGLLIDFSIQQFHSIILKFTILFHKHIGLFFLFNLKSIIYWVKYISQQFIMEQKDTDRIIEMAWEDRTPFEAIEIQFGLNETAVIALMRKELKRNSFNLWRKRVHSGISQKHAQKRNPEISRFKCSRQKAVSMNKISKR